MGRAGTPPTSSHRPERKAYSRRWTGVDGSKARTVRPILIEIGLFGRGQISQIGLDGREVCLSLGILELRDRDGRENPDDHDDDQEFDEGETAAWLAHMRTLGVGHLIEGGPLSGTG